MSLRRSLASKLRLLHQLLASGIEEFRARGDLRGRVLPVVFVFDAKRAAKLLAFEFRHHRLDVADAGAPRHIVGFRALFIEILEVQADDPALAVDRRIRAVTKDPGAWTMFGDTRIKLQPVTVSPHVTDLAPGEVQMRDGEVLVGTGSHAVALDQVQEAGRNLTDAKTWFSNQKSAVVFE